MTAVQFTKPPVDPSYGRRPFRYTLARYHAAIDAGILDENDKVELIFNELIEKMPVGKRHRDCVDTLSTYLTLKYGHSYRCATQNPVTLLDSSEPEPDFTIIDKESYAQRQRHPLAQDIMLLIEVADSTLEYDRSTKAVMYALAGVKEYWIINLREDQIEVHTDPNTSAGVYNTILRYSADKIFQSPFCGEVRVSDLLP